VVELWLTMCKTLDSIPTTTNNSENILDDEMFHKWALELKYDEMTDIHCTYSDDVYIGTGV
jgi:hypothetical protein